MHSVIPKGFRKNIIDNTYIELQNTIMNGFINIEKKQLHEIMTDSILNAKQKIYATSVEIGNDNFWSSKEGETIFSLNASGISKKGIKIQRIFIYNLDQTEKVELIIKKQLSADVKVSTICKDSNTRGAYEDFIVIDDKITILINEDGSARMSIDKEIVNRFMKKFDRYNKQATKR